MLKSNQIARFFFVAITALLVSMISLSTVSANSLSSPASTLTSESNLKIKIKIIIIIIVKKKGIAEVSGMRLATEKGALANNEILAEAWVEGNQLQVQTLKGKHSKMKIAVPTSFKAPKELSLKLGVEKGIVLNRGIVDFRTNSLGNFEIQD